MDPDTGHLLKLLNGVDLKKLLQAGYEEIPQELAAEAKVALGEQSETYVDLSDVSPLSQWAADHRRHKAKNKARNRRLRKESKQRKRR